MNTQSNTQGGPIIMDTADDLTGKEGRLVKLGSTGLAEVAAITDRTPYLVDEVLTSAKAAVIPLTAGKNSRVVAKGTGSKGDVLVLADPSTAADKGKLRKLPATTGNYHAVAIAEEDFVDGQLVLCRKIDRELIEVA